MKSLASLIALSLLIACGGSKDDNKSLVANIALEGEEAITQEQLAEELNALQSFNDKPVVGDKSEIQSGGIVNMSFTGSGDGETQSAKCNVELSQLQTEEVTKVSDEEYQILKKRKTLSSTALPGSSDNCETEDESVTERETRKISETASGALGPLLDSIKNDFGRDETQRDRDDASIEITSTAKGLYNGSPVYKMNIAIAMDMTGEGSGQMAINCSVLFNPEYASHLSFETGNCKGAMSMKGSGKGYSFSMAANFDLNLTTTSREFGN